MVDNILLVALGTIAMETHSPAKFISNEVDHLLDCTAAYPNDGTMFRASKMQLATHSDAGYLNKNKAKSRASAHMYLSENVPILVFNGAVISIAQSIKFVMSLASDA